MTEDQDAVAQLLQLAGRRPAPPPESMARIRAATHAAWQQELNRRSRRRWLAMAASLLVLTGAGLITLRMQTGDPEILVARLLSSASSLHLDRQKQVDVGVRDPQVLRAGDRLSTGADAGASLAQLPSGATTLRLDRNTEVIWKSATELTVKRGAVYVDTGEGKAAGGALVLQVGDVRIQHVGTRFLTRVLPSRVQVLVRDGQVRMQKGADSRLAGRGEMLDGPWATQGSLSAVRVATAGKDWAWADELAPAMPIEGLHLEAVLKALAWQAGLQLQFADETVAAHAREIVLHGPAIAMSPRLAIDTILATTRLRVLNSDDLMSGSLRIGMAEGFQPRR